MSGHTTNHAYRGAAPPPTMWCCRRSTAHHVVLPMWCYPTTTTAHHVVLPPLHRQPCMWCYPSTTHHPPCGATPPPYPPSTTHHVMLPTQPLLYLFIRTWFHRQLMHKPKAFQEIKICIIMGLRAITLRRRTLANQDPFCPCNYSLDRTFGLYVRTKLAKCQAKLDLANQTGFQSLLEKALN